MGEQYHLPAQLPKQGTLSGEHKVTANVDHRARVEDRIEVPVRSGATTPITASRALCDVRARCCSDNSSKRGDEGTRIRETDIVRDLSHAAPTRETMGRMSDTEVGTPTSEAHAGFAFDDSRQRACARTDRAAPIIEGPVVRRVGLEHGRDPPKAVVLRERDANSRRRCGLQQVEQDTFGAPARRAD